MLEKGKSVKQVAAELGVCAKTLRSWIEHHEQSQRGNALRIQELEREVRQLKRELADSQENVERLKNGRHTQQTVKERYQVISRLRKEHSMQKLCRVLGMTSSGHYAYLNARPSKRARQDIAIREAILISHKKRTQLWRDNVHADVHETIKCGRNRIRRLMREMGVRSTCKRPFKVNTTNSKHEYKIADNLVKTLQSCVQIRFG